MNSGKHTMDMIDLQNFPRLFIFDQLRVMDQLISVAGNEYNPNEEVILSLAEALRKASQGGRVEMSRRLPNWIKKQHVILMYLPDIEKSFISLDSLVSNLKYGEKAPSQESNLKKIVEFISSSNKNEYSLLIERLPRWMQECDVVFHTLEFESKIRIVCTSESNMESESSIFIVQQTVKILSELSEKERQKLLLRLPQWIAEQEEVFSFFSPEEKIKTLISKSSSKSVRDSESLASQIAEELSKVSADKFQYFLDKLPDWIKEKPKIFNLLTPGEKIKILFTKSNNSVDNVFLISEIVEILSELSMRERKAIFLILPNKIQLCDSILALLSFDIKFNFILKQASIESQVNLEDADFKKKLISDIKSNLKIQDFDKENLQKWLIYKHGQWLLDLQKKEQEALFELKRQEQEQVGVQQFVNLKKKYLVEGYNHESPLDPLHPILIKIDSDEWLEEEQIEFLKGKYLFATLAIFFQNKYKNTFNPWDLVKASGYWRDARYPNESIQITNDLLNQRNSLNGDIRGAILTTRGGAFRDLRAYEDAERCANSAVQINPRNYYPYNLLGALYFERGNAEQGEEYFLKALELGAPRRSQEKQMKRALNNAGHGERQAIAQYLLQRDPVKYRWAVHYL